jgi:hypothetical protein
MGIRLTEKLDDKPKHSITEKETEKRHTGTRVTAM